MAALPIVPPPLPRSLRVDPLARRTLFALLGGLRNAELTVVDDAVQHHFGSPAHDGLRATVQVRAPHAYTSALRGSIGLARAYVDGLWECDDLVALIRIVARNLDVIDRWQQRVRPLVEPLRAGVQWVQRNTRERARVRVGAHYDLGNELFAAMLDETMAYSCAVFPSPDADLRSASVAKMDMVCAKLGLRPGHELVEIGGGWGGLAIHAAQRYGCRVTTTTVSREQHDLIRERVDRAGLHDRVRVLLDDYRDLRGRYDRIVSIEMIEAVGWHYYDTFFAQCARLLADDGAMLVQAIVTSDRLYRQWRAAPGLANTVIFPGGTIPSIEAMLRSTAAVTDMRLVGFEDISQHYPPTLRRWRERFLANRWRLDADRYDERFARLWEFYLAYCEGAFAEGRIRDVQMLMARPDYRGGEQLTASAVSEPVRRIASAGSPQPRRRHAGTVPRRQARRGAERPWG